MESKLLVFVGLFFISLFSFAQYTTPDTSVDWTLDDIAAQSPTTVTISGSVYTLHEDLIIAPNDILRIDTDLTLEIEADLLITVFGAFITEADQTLITAVDQNSPYEGLRFEEYSQITIQNTTIEYGGGLRVLTEDFTLDQCIIRNNVSGTATGAVVALSRGIVNITNNHFLDNMNPAINSGANQSVSGNIVNNIIEANNSTNNNRPQINMGPTYAADTLRISNNTIIGDRDFNMVGGIAISNLVGSGTILAIVEGNTIKDNRYGITIAGTNSYVKIKNNVIEDNDTQGNPNLGGSGINLNSPSGGQTIILSENEIRRNLWGITIQGPINANLGDDEDNPGGNVFADNINNETVFALYNNGTNTIMAKHNCWIEGQEITLADAESVIFHQADDSSLGEVVFDPVCEQLSTDNFIVSSFKFYPNPTQNTILFDNELSFKTLQIIDIQGEIVFQKPLVNGNNEIFFNLSAGVYFAKFENKDIHITRKLVVK